MTLGLAWRGAASAATLRDYEVAKELRLPISVHANNFQSSAGGIAAARRRAAFSAPDVQVIHAVWCTREEVRALANTRTTVSVSPYSEMRIGFGMPIVAQLLEADVNVGLSVDTPALQRQRRHVRDHEGDSEHRERPRARRVQAHGTRVLELATIDGARSMGLGDASAR